MSLYVFLALVVVSSVGIIGDLLVKHAANDGMLYLCAAGALCYAATTPGWYYILKGSKMAVSIGYVYPAIQAIIITFVGYWYGETLTRKEMMAALMALASILLLAGKE